MTGRRRDARRRTRSAKSWTIRVLLAAFVIAAGVPAITQPLALSTRNLELARGLAPYDDIVEARYAASLIATGASPADRSYADRLARNAIERNPVNVIALSTLGLNSDFRGDANRTRQLFSYSSKLSRRNLETQLWAIENAVQRNDVFGALKHYDIALRTHPEVSQILYPIMASASADPAIRMALIQTLATKPAWWDSFTTYVSNNGPDPQSVAKLLFGLNNARVAVPEETLAAAIDGLVAAKLANEAWTFYAARRAGADRRRSRDPRFAAGLEHPSQLDWIAISAPGLTSSIQNGAFEFATSPGTGGPLLQQVQLLPAGTYRISGYSTGVQWAQGSRAYWVLRCMGGAELGRVDISSSTGRGGSFGGVYTVPTDCPVQMLELIAHASDALQPLVGKIDQVELAPAG